VWEKCRATFFFPNCRHKRRETFVSSVRDAFTLYLKSEEQHLKNENERAARLKRELTAATKKKEIKTKEDPTPVDLSNFDRETKTKMRNPSCRAFLSAFDETIATHPRSIAGATFLLCIACTAVAFLVTGIRVSTEGSLLCPLSFFRTDRLFRYFWKTTASTLSLSLERARY
jgi:hypothetical protein